LNIRISKVQDDSIPNGSGAAAILAAGIGCFAVGALAVGADTSMALKNLLNFYKPTGPLSGVTTVAIIIWLICWAVLDWRWKTKTVRFGRVNLLALALLALALLLTFPPVAELF
jgi:hypothetical protein